MKSERRFEIGIRLCKGWEPGGPVVTSDRYDTEIR